MKTISLDEARRTIVLWYRIVVSIPEKDLFLFVEMKLRRGLRFKTSFPYTHPDQCPLISIY